MKPARAASRRFLPGSPFNVLPVDPPVEQFAVRDRVTGDKYGLGQVRPGPGRPGRGGRRGDRRIRLAQGAGLVAVRQADEALTHLPLPEPTARERTVGEMLSLLTGTGATVTGQQVTAAGSGKA